MKKDLQSIRLRNQELLTQAHQNEASSSLHGDSIDLEEKKEEAKEYSEYTSRDLENILRSPKKYGKQAAMDLHGIPLDTLKSLVTRTNKNREEEEACQDGRRDNGHKPYAEFDDQLITFIKQKREALLPVSRLMVKMKARDIITQKSFKNSDGWLDAFLKRNQLSRRKRTQTVSYFEELDTVMEQADDDILFLNFDKVNISFDLLKDYTIESQGIKQVPLVTTHKGRETCTIACCITSDGQSLAPLLIFKYKSTAPKKKPIAQKEDSILQTKSS